MVAIKMKILNPISYNHLSPSKPLIFTKILHDPGRKDSTSKKSARNAAGRQARFKASYIYESRGYTEEILKVCERNKPRSVLMCFLLTGNALPYIVRGYIRHSDDACIIFAFFLLF